MERLNGMHLFNHEAHEEQEGKNLFREPLNKSMTGIQASLDAFIRCHNRNSET